MTNKDTRFQKGKSGNPKGRPQGSRNASTMAAEMLLQGEAEAITRKCVDMAMEGNSTALRLCVSRMLPVKRDRNINIDLPALKGAKDALGAISAVLNAVANGEISPSEGQAVASTLETHRRTFEVEELEHRIETLEAQQRAAR